MIDDDFDSWEAHVELRDRCDYAGLVRLCEPETSRDPGDFYAVERLGQAYVLNGEHNKAIRTMEPYHREYPDIDGFQWVILDALFAQGKTEIDFDWSTKPVVLRIGPEVAEICFEYLRPKRKPRSIGCLQCELLYRGYLTFTEDQLLELLQKDARFDVCGRALCAVEVRVRRPRRRTGRVR